ncbi:MAG: cryptochrome/photolyase family protein [Alteromonadaceae bacterium]|nr:cryptochrome/photolyase family protein [Alteromonadaceae bacterium]
MNTPTKLCLVLGDQLTASLSSIRTLDPKHDWILMAEVAQEAKYVKHHKKKIAFIFSAMRHFAAELKSSGYQVRYRRIDDGDNKGGLFDEVLLATQELNVKHVVITKPGEYRLLAQFETWSSQLGTQVDLLDDDRFLATQTEFEQWAKGKKQLRMEFFYRVMRQKWNVLMENGKPIGGKWNYDQQNRKKLPKQLAIPEPDNFALDACTEEVIKEVEQRFAEHFGDLTPFHYAVTRTQALSVLTSFIDNRLALFGDYQDAMQQGQDWLFHSHISLYINVGLLTPLETIRAAEQAYYAGTAPLNAVEGFIRQVLGWREYVRGLYWFSMPGYEKRNGLQATRPLPDFFWTGKTKMNCLSECIRNTRENAYAHHIQRLMVLGNFALLAGLNPEEVQEWYLLVYIDAFEWVELPNVNGMILFADDGLLASKPYAASGAYINKMSNYCQHCHYKVNVKLGEDACPFNYLYWHFLIKHKDKFANNPRMAMIYRTLEKKTEEDVQAIKVHSHAFFEQLKRSGEELDKNAQATFTF